MELPPIFLISPETAQHHRQRLQRLLERLRQLPQNVKASPLQIAVGGAVAPFRFLWDMARGTADIAADAARAGAQAIVNPVASSLHAVSAIDKATGGFLTALPQYYDEFKRETAPTHTPSQEVAALAGYLVSRAPADFFLHALGASAEQAVAQLEEGDVSGAISSAAMGGLTLTMLHKPVSRINSITERLVQRNYGASKLITTADIQAALQPPKPIVATREQLQRGLPATEPAKAPPAAGETVKPAAAEAAVRPEAAAEPVKPVPAAEAAVKPVSAAEAVQAAAVKDAAGVGPRNAAVEAAQVQAPGLEALRELESAVQELKVKADPKVAKKVAAIADYQYAALKADAANAVFGEMLASQSPMLIQAFIEMAKTEPKIISKALIDYMEANPDLTGQAIMAGLHLDPKSAAKIAADFVEAVRTTSTGSGAFLAALSKVATTVRASAVAQSVHDAVLRAAVPPPGMQWMSAKLAQSYLGKVLADTLTAADEVKWATRARRARKEVAAATIMLRNDLKKWIKDDALVERLAADPSLHASLELTGRPPQVMSVEQALKFVEELESRGVPQLDQPHIVLEADPFPGVPIEDVPAALRTATARARLMRAVPERMTAELRAENELLLEYTRPSPAKALAQQLARLSDQQAKTVWLERRGPVARWWALMEAARGSFALANPRTATRDVLNTAGVAATMTMDKLLAAVVDTVYPGKAPTLDALMSAADELLSTMRHPAEAWAAFDKLVDMTPEASKAWRSTSIPIELMETIRNNELIGSVTEEAARSTVVRMAGVTNLLRTSMDRLARTTYAVAVFPYELERQGITAAPGMSLFDTALDILSHPDSYPNETVLGVKKALYETTLQASEASMAATPMNADMWREAVDIGAVQEAMQSSLGDPNLRVRVGQMESIGSMVLTLFRRVPALHTIISLYPRFMWNVYRYMVDHSPTGLLALATPEFHKMMRSESREVRMQAAEHIGKSLNGALMLATAYAVQRHSTMGKPYLLDVTDEEGRHISVDLRNYRPFDLYMDVAAWLGHWLFDDPRPNMNANELFDMATGLRRMTDQPISALSLIFEQLARGNDAALNELGGKLLNQIVGPLLTPIIAARESVMAARVLANPELAREWYAQPDMATSPHLAAVSRINREFANEAAQRIGGDAYYAIPRKIDPFTGEVDTITHPGVFYLTGFILDEVPAFKRALLKAGLDPVQAVDPSEKSPLYANLHRRVLGEILTAPLHDPATGSDIAAALDNGMGLRHVPRERGDVAALVKRLVEETGLQQHAKPEIVDPDFARAAQDFDVDPTLFVRLIRKLFLDPAVGKEEADRIYAQSRTVGDFAAAVILDDRVAQRFTTGIKGIVKPLTINESRKYVAQQITNIITLRLTNMTTTTLLQASAPWLLSEQLYGSLPKELRQRSTPAVMNQLRQMTPKEAVKYMETVRAAAGSAALLPRAEEIVP